MTTEIPIEVVHKIGEMGLTATSGNVNCKSILCINCPIYRCINNPTGCYDIYKQAIPQLAIHYPELFI